MEIFALDLGNKQTKLMSSKKSYRLPSHFTDLQTGGINALSINNHEDFDVDNYSIDDNLFTWGKDIDKVSDPVSIRDTIAFGERRYTNENFKLLCEFAVAKLANDFVDDDSDTLNVNIVTGLPTEDFEKANCIKAIKSALNRHFILSINDKPLDVQVNNVIVIPQPIGTVYDTIYNQSKTDIATELINVVDCGGGTTLIDTLHNLDYDVNNTTQFENGAYRLFKSIARNMDLKTKANIYKVEETVREGMDKGKFIYHVKKDVDVNITKLVKKEIEKFTNNVIENVEHSVLNLDSVDELIFTGGGSQIIDHTMITDAFPNASFTKHGEMSNVFGFYKFGTEALKEG